MSAPHDTLTYQAGQDHPTSVEAADAYLTAVLELAPRRRCAQRYPRLLMRLLPEPTRSDVDYARFTNTDIAAMMPAQARLEAAQLRTALAVVLDPDDLDVPVWIRRRLSHLDARGHDEVAA